MPGQEVITCWQNSSNLDDVGIVDLLLYALIFSFYDKIESMEEDKDPEGSSISHTGTCFIFSVRGIQFIGSSIEKLLFFNTSICILAFLQSFIWNILILAYFNKIRVSKTRKFAISNMKSFQLPLWLKRLRFQPPK